MPGKLASTREPDFHEEKWRRFLLAVQANSARSKISWPIYRRGLRRLRRSGQHRLPRQIVLRLLAEDAFYCATHWNLNDRIVQRALKDLGRQTLSISTRVFASVEYLQWAQRNAKHRLPAAAHMLAQASEKIELADELTQENLRRMIRVELETRPFGRRRSRQ
jgi:hypothetical protein